VGCCGWPVFAFLLMPLPVFLSFRFPHYFFYISRTPAFSVNEKTFHLLHWEIFQPARSSTCSIFQRIADQLTLIPQFRTGSGVIPIWSSLRATAPDFLCCQTYRSLISLEGTVQESERLLIRLLGNSMRSWSADVITACELNLMRIEFQLSSCPRKQTFSTSWIILTKHQQSFVHC